MRVRLTAVALLLTLVTTVWAADQFIVEDWSKHAVGAKGILDGWKGQNWGSPKYDFTIENDGGRKVLHMKSANEGSTIAKDIKGKVNLKETPILEWSWKVTVLPKGADSCKKELDDQAAQVFVVWPRFPEAVRSRVIGYVWDTTEPVGKICKSEKTGTVTYFVLRSGAAELGKWITERRNVAEDFKKVYDDDADSPGAVSIAIDSNDTRSTAESFVGAIFLKKR
ncbi:MAG: hypothetical protein DMD78_21165 [Candidatus Rokuibacteriota bacterium]|nr:MAG: hypothetical protein DMD78_21165 [Candidatus Rokubacteria bacterium]